MRRRALAAVVLVALALLAFFSLRDGRGSKRGRGRSRVTSSCTRSAPEGGDDTARRPAKARAAQPPIPEKTLLDPEARRETRDALKEKLGARFPRAKPTSEPEAPAPPLPEPAFEGPRIKKEYIQERVREDFFPLARGCYDDLLKRHPKIQGKVALHFTIVGDEGVGGIVEEASVGDESTLRDDEFDTCMTESMLSMSFPPPKGGGVVTVIYPIAFSPDEDEEADGGAPKK